jgi:hypothetical protein
VLSVLSPSIAALWLIASSWAAHAGRPLQTEDAGILEAGSCEIESHVARIAGADTRERAASLQFGCGVGAATQLALALARARADRERGSGGELNGKTRLWRGVGSDVDAPALTLAYALSSLKVAGEARRHSASEVQLAYTRTLRSGALLHANLGHARDERARARTTTWGLAVEAAPWGAWTPMAEAFGDDRQPAWWNLGLRAAVVRERLFVDGSYGRQLSGASPHWVTLGVKLVF